MAQIGKFVRSVGTDMQSARGNNLEVTDHPRAIGKKRIPICTCSIHDALIFSCTSE